ncbi:uncharacterized protein LOC144159986 [Haemaphysalis longicornis]
MQGGKEGGTSRGKTGTSTLATVSIVPRAEARSSTEISRKPGAGRRSGGGPNLVENPEGLDEQPFEEGEPVAEEGDHGVDHGVIPSAEERADEKPGGRAEKEPAKDDAYDEDAEKIVGVLKAPDLICTVGPTLNDDVVYPIAGNLCDLYVFTHVTVVGSDLGTSYGISSYITFRKMAGDSVRFGVSLSPAYVEAHPEYQPSVGSMMQRLEDEYGIDSIGVLGARVTPMGLRPGLAITKWITGLSSVQDPRRQQLFLGIVLEAHYPSLRLDSDRQRTLARTLSTQMEALRVDLLVLITHLWNVASLHDATKCVTQPTSRWTRQATEDKMQATAPDLETSARILGYFKSNATRTFLSMTMAVIRFKLNQNLGKHPVLGSSCLEARTTSFSETCSSTVRHGTRGGFDSRSLTSWFANTDSLFSYEDRASITAKMKGVLHVLQSEGNVHTGWALFDIQHELLRPEDCDLQFPGMDEHWRLRAVRDTLLSSRVPHKEQTDRPHDRDAYR